MNYLFWCGLEGCLGGLNEAKGGGKCLELVIDINTRAV